MAASSFAQHWLIVAGAVVMGAYFVALVVFDRYLSTRPSRDLLFRFARSLRHGAGHHGARDPATGAQLERDLDSLVNGVHRHRLGWISLTEVLSAWRFAHELERRAWAGATPDEVRARLATARHELALLADDQVATALVGDIDEVLHPKSPAPGPPPRPSGLSLRAGRWELSLSRAPGPEAGADPRASEPARAALLEQVLRILHDRRDTRFESLSDLQTKSVWLAVLGLLVIVIASVTLGHEALFVLGALGAFVSRLGRLLRRTPSEFDYGASSGALYLSPVAGAVGGWLGVLVVDALADPALHVLGSTFTGLWDRPGSLLPYAVATVFGFSERVLNRVLREAEQAVAPPAPARPAGRLAERR